MSNESTNNALLKLQIFKLITEYQIRWLSTSYEIPGLSYQIIIKQFPTIPSETAVELLNEWLQFETNRNISVYDKARFNADSNVETILKLQALIRELDANIMSVIQKANLDSKEAKKANGEAFSIEKKDDNVTITFFNRSWFKRDNVISLNVSEAKKLQVELKKVLSSKS